MLMKIQMESNYEDFESNKGSQSNKDGSYNHSDVNADSTGRSI